MERDKNIIDFVYSDLENLLLIIFISINYYITIFNEVTAII